MAFGSLPPIIYMRNKTNETIKKVEFRFQEGSSTSRIKKLKPLSKEQAAIPVWGVPITENGYINLIMKHELNGNEFEDIILDKYNKRINLLVEVESINTDGSFKISTKIMGVDEIG